MNNYSTQVASNIRRFAAYMIDSLILLLPTYIMLVLFIKFQEAWNIINVIISCAYFTYFLSSDKQATPGQRLMKIYTVRCDRKKIDLKLAFDRSISVFLFPLVIILLSKIMIFINQQSIYVYFIISMQLIVSLLIVLWYGFAIFSKNKQTIHDIIFKTMVVKGKL